MFHICFKTHAFEDFYYPYRSYKRIYTDIIFGPQFLPTPKTLQSSRYCLGYEFQCVYHNFLYQIVLRENHL